MTEKATPEKTMTEAVKLRKTVKARNPKFRQHESWRYKRLKEKWRKPRGLDNRMRLKAKGWPKSVNVGYGGPRTARGLHPSGFEEVLVHTPDEISDVNPKTQAIRIAHTVGTRKRIHIASLARERNIRVLNPLVRREIEEEEKAEEEVAEETAVELEETKAEAKTEAKKKPKRSKRSKRAKEVKENEP